MRRVADDANQPLPAWRPFKTRLVEGIKAWALILLYALPFLLIQGLAALLRHLVAPVFAPQVIGPIATGLGVIATLLGLYGAYLLMGALTRLAITRSLRQALSPAAARAAIERAPSVYAVAFAGGILGVAALVAFGGLILGVGILFGLAWCAPFVGHLLGQAERFAREN